MKRNNTTIRFENNKIENFAVLNQNEMIKIKGGGKDNTEPPISK